MKKLLSLLLVALCAVIVVPFAGCSKEVELTTDNYDEYILLTTSYNNIDIEYISDSEYYISFAYCIYATPKGDYRFNNVEISFTLESSVWSSAYVMPEWSTENQSALSSYLAAQHPTLSIDYYGYGCVSQYEYKQATRSNFNVANTDFTKEIYSISGTVTV